MQTTTKLTKSEAELTAIEIARAELIDRARSSLLGFITYTKKDYRINWHHRLLCKYLDRLISGEIKRLMVFMPPRYGKSEAVSRRLPAYIFGKNPDASVIACSYGADLASRMNRDVQRIMDTDLYREIFPETQLNGSKTRTVSNGTWLRNSDIFEIVGRRGVYRCAGIGQGITGLGASIAVIDDPIKDQAQADSPVYRQSVWDWYVSTLYTRLEKGASICLTLTRWHEDDLAGRLLRASNADPQSDQWTVLSLPAIREDTNFKDDPRHIGDALWPAKYNLDRLNQIKASVGTYVWNALYQQRPSSSEGNVIKREWWKYWRALPASFDRKLISADLTFGASQNSDYCVIQAWGKIGAQKYLIDQVRDRMDFPTQIQAFKSFCAKHSDIVEKVIEEKANGAALIASLKKEITGLIPFNPKTSKENRAAAISPEIEAGNVFIPDPSVATWVHDFVEECSSFPKGKNDDMLDSATQACLRFQSTGSADFEESFLQKKPQLESRGGFRMKKTGGSW